MSGNVPHDPRVDALYNTTATQGIPQQGRAILVIGWSACPACHNSIVNTGYAQSAGNGIPVRWLDIASSGSMLRNVPGIVINGNSIESVGGQPFEGTPTYVIIENGRAVAVAGVGQLDNRQQLDMMAAQAQARGAVIGSITPGTGEPMALTGSALAGRSDQRTL